MTIRIRERSILAWLAAKNLKSRRMALVIGKTIFLYGTTREEFLSNTKWVRHEVAHVLQYQQRGFIVFILSYLMETFNMGYEFNKYEKDAIKKERDHTILEGVTFI